MPHPSLEDVEPVLFWFSRLETARQSDDWELVRRAICKLEQLGVVVRFVQPMPRVDLANGAWGDAHPGGEGDR